jgi:alpha-galactosidase
MSRADVVDHLFETISGLLGSAPISYLKWDLNRVITEPYGSLLPPARQGEFFHRYMLGVYDLIGRLGEAFPDVLFESCAAGGGRFDAGMLAFAPQAWVSDQMDPIDRLRIQWGASVAYPPSTMGAHVSGSPSHVVRRATPLDTRAAVAFFGAFGYELDLTALSEADRSRVAEQVAWYKQRRELFQQGRFLRLRSPFAGDGNEVAWMSLDDDGSHAVVGWYRILAHALPGPSALRLRGLEAGALYQVAVWPDSDDTLAQVNERVRGGDDLMSVGLLLDDHAWEAQARGDFQARIFELTRLPDG